jgi:hypothetical protein
MTTDPADDLQASADAAVRLDGVESAVIFVVLPGSDALLLGAAAGIAGPALNRLADAVQDPEHPIARTLADGRAAYDVTPTAPGGPALRSHLPIGGDGQPVTGVLAVAHEAPLDGATRAGLESIATSAASLTARPGQAARVNAAQSQRLR